MPMSVSKFVPHLMKTSVIKVYSYVDRCPVGTLSNPSFKSDLVFKSAMELLRIIDELQDEMNFPQKSMSTRKFSDDSTSIINKPSEGLERFADMTPAASFKLSVLFRQNASWQGSISWVEKNLSTEFRSALEMMFLIDNVLSGEESAET